MAQEKEYEWQQKLIDLKYKLKRELEELIHKDIMEEISRGHKDKKPRETRRGN